jgi:hypothetical protein
LHRIESNSACGSVVVYERAAEDDAGSGGRHVADTVPVLPQELAHKSTHGVILGKFPPLNAHRIVSGLTTDLFKVSTLRLPPCEWRQVSLGADRKLGRPTIQFGHARSPLGNLCWRLGSRRTRLATSCLMRSRGQPMMGF